MKTPLSVVRHDDHHGLLGYFAQHWTLRMLMLELIASGKQTIQCAMNRRGVPGSDHPTT